MGLKIFTVIGDDTWTVPDGLTSLGIGSLDIYGRGGNGGDGSVVPGGGGGGGGEAANDIFSVTAGTVYNLHVGDYAERTWFNTSSFLWADPGPDGDSAGNGGSGGTGGGSQAFVSHTGGTGANGDGISTGGGAGGCAGNSGNGNNGSGSTGGALQDNGGAGGDGGGASASGENGDDPGGGGGGDGLLGVSPGTGGGSKIILSWNDGHITITVQPTNTDAGVTIFTITVEIRDFGDSVDTNAVQNCSVQISSNPSGGTLSGTTSVAPVSGVYTFSDLSIDNAGSGYKLNFYKDNGAGGLIQMESDAFDITTPAAAAGGSTLSLMGVG